MASEICICGQHDNCGDCTHVGGKITIVFSTEPNIRTTVEVEERVYPDRSCGQWEGGWRCYSRHGFEYFISDSGTVWAQPANIDCGIAPAIKAAADKMDRMLDRAALAEELADRGLVELGIPIGYENAPELD